jgi:HD-like signal output (HDOD) protein
MGVSHAEIGGYLLGIWGLPYSVLEAVAHHHQPRRVPHDVFDSFNVLHVSNYLAHEHPVHPQASEKYPHRSPDPEYQASMRIADQLPAWHEMAEEAANELREGGPGPAERAARQQVRA